MTWIIGSAAFWGSAILISDICVTFEYANGRKEHHDCLQKIYPLGENVMCGFSGSVLLGFRMIDTFRSEITALSNGVACNVNVLANTRWPRVARRVFRAAGLREKRQGCAFIVASAHPTVNVKKTSFPSLNIHIFRSPEFTPVVVERKKVVSIGSGNGVAAYMNILKNIENDTSLIQLGANTPTMLAFVVGNRIIGAVEQFPMNGVSKYNQYGVVSRNTAIVKNLEYSGPTVYLNYLSF